MKLWMKITLGVTALTLLILSGCLYAFFTVQAAYARSSMEENGLSMLELFRAHLSSVEQLGSVDTTHPAAVHSAVQYAFLAQARLLQSSDAFYALQTENGLCSTASPYDWSSLFTLQDHQAKAWTTQALQDGYVFVAGTRMQLFHAPYVLYIAKDVTSVFQQLDAMRRIALLLLAAGMLLLLVCLPLLVQRFLRPLRELSQTAQRIAAGEYSLRAQLRNHDEIAEMGRQFHLMADAMEGKIQQLSEMSQNKTFMLGALTHELKTPLTAIIGYADTYLHVPLDGKQRDYCVRQIFDAGRRTERLSQKLMQLIALESSPEIALQALNAADFLQAVQAGTEQILSAKRQTLVIQNHISQLCGDGDLLISLLCNLIENASRASEPGVAIELTLWETESETLLSIQDHGYGIPEAQLKSVMEPFYRVDKARDRQNGGAGLGLALCKAIASAHQGTLTIASQVGAGTCVTLALPRR